MTTLFPAALDTFVNPTTNNTLANSTPKHSEQHANLNDSIAALEARVGVTGSAVTSSLTYRIAQLEATQGGVLAIATKTSAYTATTSDEVLLCDCSGGAFTITLPPAVDATRKTLTIKKIDDSDNFLTIQAHLTEAVDGRNTQFLPIQFNSLRLVSNGTAWFIIP